MNYTLQEILDRIVEHPGRYRLTNTETSEVLGTFDLVPVPGTVTVTGTPVNKALLQRYENVLFGGDFKLTALPLPKYIKGSYALSFFAPNMSAIVGTKLYTPYSTMIQVFNLSDNSTYTINCGGSFVVCLTQKGTNLYFVRKGATHWEICSLNTTNDVISIVYTTNIPITTVYNGWALAYDPIRDVLHFGYTDSDHLYTRIYNFSTSTMGSVITTALSATFAILDNIIVDVNDSANNYPIIAMIMGNSYAVPYISTDAGATYGTVNAYSTPASALLRCFIHMKVASNYSLIVGDGLYIVYLNGMTYDSVRPTRLCFVVKSDLSETLNYQVPPFMDGTYVRQRGVVYDSANNAFYVSAIGFDSALSSYSPAAAIYKYRIPEDFFDE